MEPMHATLAASPELTALPCPAISGDNPFQQLLERTPNGNPTLSELIHLYQEIEEALIESGGVAELGDQIALVESAIEGKLDRTKGLLNYWKGQVSYLDGQEKLYKERKASIRNGIEWLRGIMRGAMLGTGKEKIKTAEGTYYFTKPRQPIRIKPECMTPKYAAAMRKLGLANCTVTITMPDDRKQDWLNYARELKQQLGDACEVSVSEPAYDLEAIAARWTLNRRRPPFIEDADKTFTIR